MSLLKSQAFSFSGWDFHLASSIIVTEETVVPFRYRKIELVWKIFGYLSDKKNDKISTSKVFK